MPPPARLWSQARRTEESVRRASSSAPASRSPGRASASQVQAAQVGRLRRRTAAQPDRQDPQARAAQALLGRQATPGQLKGRRQTKTATCRAGRRLPVDRSEVGLAAAAEGTPAGRRGSRGAHHGGSVRRRRGRPPRAIAAPIARAGCGLCRPIHRRELLRAIAAPVVAAGTRLRGRRRVAGLRRMLVAAPVVSAVGGLRIRSRAVVADITQIVAQVLTIGAKITLVVTYVATVVAHITQIVAQVLTIGAKITLVVAHLVVTYVATVVAH